MKVNIDIDNTVNNFIQKFVELCNRMKVADKEFSVDDMTQYSLQTATGIDNDTLTTLFFKNPCFYKKLEPLDDAYWVIEEMNKKHEVKFVTSIDYDVIDSRIEFVQKYFPFIDINRQLLVTNDKHSIYAEMVIDDYVKNMDNVNPDCTFLLFNQPWNKLYDTKAIRVSSWYDIYTKLETMDFWSVVNDK